MNSQLLLRTDIQDQRSPEWTCRGSRYWSHAEISPDTLYIVEGKHADAAVGVRRSRFVTSDLGEALEIPSKHGLEAVDLFAWVCLADGFSQFGKVSEAFKDTDAKGFIFSLDTGLNFRVSPSGETRNSLGLRSVFSSR